MVPVRTKKGVKILNERNQPFPQGRSTYDDQGSLIVVGNYEKPESILGI